jgi:molybdopterin-guanine dinucleotide biosynthesis adapter protein
MDWQRRTSRIGNRRIKFLTIESGTNPVQSLPSMKRVHVVGCKNSGKTTLIVELVSELTARGYRVGTIKHSSHRHELDVPGKDSHRHRLAGGSPAAAITETMIALHLPLHAGESAYTLLERHYEECDLVLVEGGLDSTAPKVEVWRRVMGNKAIARERDDVVAVVTDDAVEVDVPCWPRSNVSELADRIVALTGSPRTAKF